MGLSSFQLKPIAYWINRSGLGHLVITTKRPRDEFEYWSVYIRGIVSGTAINVGGESRFLWLASIKAYCELGEALTLKDRKLGSKILNRSGLAAGFFFQSTANRAKLEIYERHIFLHHFRNSLSFPDVRTTTRMILGRKAECSITTIPIPQLGFFCAVRVAESDRCFLGSTGSGHDRSDSERSAFRQLDKLLSLHSKEDMSCRGDLPISPQWFHHLCSSEPQTRLLVNKLFAPNVSQDTNWHLDPRRWAITQFNSVLPHIKVVRAHHPQAHLLEFEVPERCPRGLNSKPLHPLW